jgi:hypothetical protein
MANQITIDIVAQTTKLTSGINDANTQIDGMSNKLKGAAAAAGAAASAFVLKQGITFLKQGIDEAKEAQEVMTAATTTFGEGSAALEKITADATKFGKELAVDNDELIALATQLGSRLPANVQASSVELVKIFKDVEAFTGGAVTAEAASGKLAKAFADGELKATELTKVFPGLEQSVYAQAEALSKAGKNQEALNLLTESGSKKYDDAAAKNATSTQKFEVALANFKEMLGTKVLPLLEKGIDFLTKMIETFDGLPGPVQNLILVLGGLLAIGGPILTFLASAKTAMITLGIVTKAQTGSQIALNTAMLANPIGLVIIAIAAIIAIGVLLWKNWDTVTEYAGKLWDAVKKVFGWIKENWPLLLAILTGPIGLAILAITKNFDKIKEKASDIVDGIKDIFNGLPDKMLAIGKSIAMGLWNGISSMGTWLKNKIFDFFGNLIPGWAKKMLGISSPSKVFAKFGENIVQGLAQGIGAAENIAKNATFNLGASTISGFSTPLVSGRATSSPIAITINAGLGTNGPALGRQVSSAIRQYGKVSTQARF